MNQRDRVNQRQLALLLTLRRPLTIECPVPLDIGDERLEAFIVLQVIPHRLHIVSIVGEGFIGGVGLEV
jgi:hypothetical protein